METGNIIAVYNKNKQTALHEFESLMEKTNLYMNEKALCTDYYIGCDFKHLEEETLKAVKENCEGTLFNPEDIQLVSGLRFPDIVAAKHFGVEVKCTKENKWVSTGSSIVESTRVKDVNHIYLLFGKMGGNPVEFRCNPYQDCLHDIAVTHSPRYLINMEIPQEKTIFAKIGIEYDEFRLSKDPIHTIRTYYLEKIKEERRTAMPWWIGSDTVTAPTLRLWSKGTLDKEEQDCYKAQLLILFPEEICRSIYDRAALWLCVRHSIINLHFRDIFTAGGQTLIENKRYPAIVKRIIDMAPIVESLLYEDYIQYDIKENNLDLFNAKDKYVYWVQQIIKQYPKIKQLEKWLMEI